jgi:hypothetical protein
VTGSSFPREQPTVFRRGSNVLEYWLAHAEGFEVASRRVRPARVERVVVDPVGGRATGLIVRSFGVGRSRRRIVAADAVVAVDPFLRTLHLAHSPRALPPAGTRAASMLVAAAGRTRPIMARLPPATSAGAHAARAWLAPRLRQMSSLIARYGRELGVWIATGVAWMRPRLRALADAAWVALVGLSCAAAEAGRRVYARLVDHGSATPPSDNA